MRRTVTEQVMKAEAESLSKYVTGFDDSVMLVTDYLIVAHYKSPLLALIFFWLERMPLQSHIY